MMATAFLIIMTFNTTGKKITLFHCWHAPLYLQYHFHFQRFLQMRHTPSQHHLLSPRHCHSRSQCLQQTTQSQWNVDHQWLHHPLPQFHLSLLQSQLLSTNMIQYNNFRMFSKSRWGQVRRCK